MERFCTCLDFDPAKGHQPGCEAKPEEGVTYITLTHCPICTHHRFDHGPEGCEWKTGKYECPCKKVNTQKAPVAEA